MKGAPAPLPVAPEIFPPGWDAPDFRRRLTRWFAANHRPLPWREGYAPYPVWISEIMLQQTQVEAVLPYFERWIALFADPAAVAAAREEALLKAWEGLGYYARARNLHKAAREMVRRHGGEVPGNLEHLLALPGIGRYTAGAILSIGFNRPAPIVDGNVGRILARIFAMEHPLRSPQGQRHLWAWAEALLPTRNPRDFNQGLMELGALVCRPRQPRCDACPVLAHCAVGNGAVGNGAVGNGAVGNGAVGNGASERPEDFPRPSRKITRPLRTGVMLLARDPKGRLLLRRRPPRGLWGGLWELPWNELEGTETPARATARLLRELGQTPADTPAPLGVIAHGLTHFQLRLDCFGITLAPGHGTPGAVTGTARDAAAELGATDSALQWATPARIAKLPLARLSHKALALAE